MMKGQGGLHDAALVKVESTAQSGQEEPGRGSVSRGKERGLGNGEEEMRRREGDGKEGVVASESDGGRAGSSKSVRDGTEGEKGDGGLRCASSIENESERRKALAETKRANAKREEDEAEAVSFGAAGAEKSSEREEGELETEPEPVPPNGDQGRELDVERTKETEEVAASVGEPRTVEEGGGASVNVKGTEVDAPNVREKPEQHRLERVAESSQQKAPWNLHLIAEQEHTQIEAKAVRVTGDEEAVKVERVRRVGAQDRGFPFGSPNEGREESSEQAAVAAAAPSDEKFFMRLSGSAREREREETKEELRQSEKKQRVEDGAHLSLALPDTSLSLSSGDPRSRPQKQRRAHSQPSQQGPSHSRGFTESLSLSHSQPFQHNPSCSLTQTSMDKTELSSGSQQMSVGKEQASYGSWQKSYGSSEPSGAHDRRRPKPLYQKVLSNPQILQGSLGSDRFRGQGRERGAESGENSQGSHQVPVTGTQSDDARRALRREHKHKHRHGEVGEVWSSPSHSGDSRETQPHSKGGRNSFGQREKELAGSERREFTSISVHDIVAEPIPSMARKLQELPDSFLAGLKESLRDMLNSIEKREQFVQLQQMLGARVDLSTDVLLRAHRTQLELLVAVKTGILAFLHPDIPMTHSALVEVFLQQRCRNFSCQNQLPADDCDCKLCALKAGFCNSCMCVVCSKFDFDANTCRWIGCDFCLHWCHTDCGIRMSYITPGPSIRGAAGTTEMQFHCVACGHTSELYGFVKDVFCTCAPEWGRDVLARELDCVHRIFRGSTDTRGKQLCSKAEMILLQLHSQVDTAVASRSMIKFFDALSESGSHGATPHQAPSTPLSAETKKSSPLPITTKQPSTQTTLEMAKEALATYDSELEQKRQEASELQQERERKKAQIEELESIVRIKQAEAKMFAVRADEARREADGLHRIMLAKAEKIEQEYAGKLSKLAMEDAEDRCRKHHDAVQVLQQAQLDFRAMNQPLVNELRDLLKQLEASKRLTSWK